MKKTITTIAASLASVASAVVMTAAPVAAANDPWIAAGLQQNGAGNYVKEVTAKPGEVVNAHMQIRNTTGSDVKFGIGLTLANGLTEVDGSAKLNSSVYTGQALGKISGGQTTNIGLFGTFNNSATNPTGWAEVEYKVKVTDIDKLPKCGANRLEILNAVTAYDKGSNTIVSDTELYYTYVTVQGNACMPTTGPAAVATGIAGAAALTTAGGYFIISRKK
jgi:hypothetical protein